MCSPREIMPRAMTFNTGSRWTKTPNNSHRVVLASEYEGVMAFRSKEIKFKIHIDLWSRWSVKNAENVKIGKEHWLPCFLVYDPATTYNIGDQILSMQALRPTSHTAFCCIFFMVCYRCHFSQLLFSVSVCTVFVSRMHWCFLFFFRMVIQLINYK